MHQQQELQRINAGFIEAKRITRLHAKTFYVASLLLPRAKRYAAYAVYAACRISDDAVDEETVSRQQKLARIRENIIAAYGNSALKEPLFSALRKTVKEYAIPRDYFETLLEGMRMDLSKVRYENFTQLYDYAYKAAGVVGLIMLKIFGSANEETKERAVELGIAMQLTNIIRDVREDYLRDRIYLPEEEMRKFAVTEDDIGRKQMSQNLKELLKFQSLRAKQYYKSCEPGIRMLSDKRSRLVTRAMEEMYEALLEEIEKNDYNVFSERLYVNRLKKVCIVLRVLLHNDAD